MVVIALSGCTKPPPKKQLTRYEQLPARKNLPDYMQDTIYSRTELFRTEGMLVSGFGVVSGLDNTGDCTAPTLVRQYIINQMLKHGVSSMRIPGQGNVTPEMYLADPSFAIVEVDGYLPPGIRKGQSFDIQVGALPESSTSSIAGGNLWRTDLRLLGANRNDPGGSVNVYARCQGPIFVNPAYALERKPTDPNAKRSLRFGIVMDGGISDMDRPLGLRLLQPQYSMSRAIERRIDQRFQQQADVLKPTNVEGLAEAQDEGVVNFYVPKNYEGDWQHFAGVVMHLYMYDSPQFATNKAMALADAGAQAERGADGHQLLLGGAGRSGAGCDPRSRPHVQQVAGRRICRGPGGGIPGRQHRAHGVGEDCPHRRSSVPTECDPHAGGASAVSIDQRTDSAAPG